MTYTSVELRYNFAETPMDTLLLERAAMKHGARNDIVGEVIKLDTGDGIMGKATVKISGEFQMSSVMTKDSLEALNLKPGDQVRVLVKAVNVLLIKD